MIRTMVNMKSNVATFRASQRNGVEQDGRQSYAQLSEWMRRLRFWEKLTVPVAQLSGQSERINHVTHWNRNSSNGPIV